MVEASSAPIQMLLVEDDPEIVRTLREGLDPSQFLLNHAATIQSGRQKLLSQLFDIIVLDLNLPDGSGLAIADAVRAAGSDVPILMLTGKSTVPDRVDGFRHGADDYLCKPFAVDELIARVNAVLKRAKPGRRHLLKFADVELDLLTRSVRRHSLQATLSLREVDLLAYLMRHPDTVVARTAILEEVWGDDTDGDSNVVNVYINYLRNKLESSNYPRLIHTIRGVGYIFSETPPEEEY